jgi:flagellar biosynthesis/type III secretory pathway protein FliH
LNINYGKNRELMEKCRPLLDYARFIYYIREGIDEGVDAQRAVENAVERCLKEDVLTDVLVAHRKEVVGMFLEEYDEELHFQTLRREGYEDGMEKGMTLGKSAGEARVQLLYQKLLEDQRMDDLYRAAKEKEFMELLFKEYGM